MEKVLSYLRLSHYPPNYVLPAHIAKAQQEVLLGLNMSIDANKLVQFNMSLVNKKVLLIATTLNVTERNIQNVTKVFGIHQRLRRTTKFQQQLANKEGHELWILRVRKVRVDVVSIEVHNCIISWWITQTKVSPNKKDVT
jgi:hypothetical protein